MTQGPTSQLAASPRAYAGGGHIHGTPWDRSPAAPATPSFWVWTGCCLHQLVTGWAQERAGLGCGPMLESCLELRSLEVAVPQREGVGPCACVLPAGSTTAAWAAPLSKIFPEVCSPLPALLAECPVVTQPEFLPPEACLAGERNFEPPPAGEEEPALQPGLANVVGPQRIAPGQPEMGPGARGASLLCLSGPAPPHAHAGPA